MIRTAHKTGPPMGGASISSRMFINLSFGAGNTGNDLGGASG